MSIVQRLSRRVAQRVAEKVARHNLFEKEGERSASAPLASEPSPPASEASPVAVGDLKMPGEPEVDDVSALGLNELKEHLAPGGGLRLVNHWATWCSSCVEELPELGRLHRAIGDRVRFIGVSWDRFQPGGSIEECRAAIGAMMTEHQLRWPTLVLDDTVRPSDFFEQLKMSCQTVPQSWLIDDDGVVLERLEVALDAEAVDALIARVEALP
jgi:thiol-disulfide isomerase/thioredoxin